MEPLTKKHFIIGTIIAIILFVGTITLSVVKEPNYYQVIFDSKGGSEVAGQNILSGQTANNPIETIKEGYIFIGWYLKNKKYDFSTKVKQDIILEAKWKKIKEEQPEIQEEINKEEVKEENKQDNEINTQPIIKEEPKPKEEQQRPKEEETQIKPIVIEVSSISLTQKNSSLKVGEFTTLNVNINPVNATNKTVTWQSSNPHVATVTNGVVKAISPGSAIITATVGGKSDSCTVTVTKEISYSYEIVDIPSSSIGQCYIYIKSSEGKRVSGTINITYINGESERVEVSSNGVMKVKSTISTITIINAG